MKFLINYLSIIMILVLSTKSFASDYFITDQCRVFMLEREIDPSAIIVNGKDIFYQPTFKREGTEDIILRVVDFGVTHFGGMYASYQDASIVHCWPAFTRITGVLLEKNKYFYEPIGNHVVDAYKIHLHRHIYRGPGDIASKIETIYFVGRDYKTVFLKEVFIGDTHEYPSPWFVNYLTLEEANEFIKEYEFDSFVWHGKEYNVE